MAFWALCIGRWDWWGGKATHTYGKARVGLYLELDEASRQQLEWLVMKYGSSTLQPRCPEHRKFCGSVIPPIFSSSIYTTIPQTRFHHPKPRNSHLQIQEMLQIRFPFSRIARFCFLGHLHCASLYELLHCGLAIYYLIEPFWNKNISLWTIFLAFVSWTYDEQFGKMGVGFANDVVIWSLGEMGGGNWKSVVWAWSRLLWRWSQEWEI